MSFQQQSKLVLCPSKMDFCPTSIYLVLRYHYYITELLCTVNNLYFRIKHKNKMYIMHPVPYCRTDINLRQLSFLKVFLVTKYGRGDQLFM